MIEAVTRCPDYTPKRYKNAPPKGTEPDKSYVPKIGEWFWHSNATGNASWTLREARADGYVYREGGMQMNPASDSAYKGTCLPAEPPGPKRYSAPPPDGVAPDKDYEPKIGEWFWYWKTNDDVKPYWTLRELRHDGTYLEKGERYCKDVPETATWQRLYAGKCLPAEPPGPKRYSDPPPDGVKPDPSYEPKEGEWFWWYDGSEWVVRQRRGIRAYEQDGTERCLVNQYEVIFPTEPPE